MNRVIFAAVAVLTLRVPGHDVRAAADGDIIGQCLEDNQDEGQTKEALAAYCACANEKMMQDNYGRDIDISEWEKMNADGQEACSKEAGWISHPD